MSQPDPMEEDGVAFAPTADQEADISQTATAFQAATAPPTTTDAIDATPPEGALASLSATQGAVPALISTETPQFLAQPQPISPSAAAAAAAAGQSPAQPLTAGTSSSSPLPPRTGTPMRNTGSANPDAGSRATSQHPPDTGFVIPAEATPHGAPARRYLNTKVTGVLLEGMKLIAKEQPKDPLRVLGEFLLQRSKELEPTV
ncbi:hypothetical protein MAPG_11760 [Magnaporthiopsis poae ATCC 64411]|uniref:Dpy-30 domain-containing protein n=1 Tax=Magnaporthiopsis poae (strain ATCC 64411 / 73-15) TaxID=644358 RepID=A0A0C4EG42_MAGP6|nr:hypothetical protein MAPG_11760 [Magnaporthiopsis poae ATCC 64411]